MMKRKFLVSGLMTSLFLLACLFGPDRANAGETTEALLEILHSRGHISDQEYQDLKEKSPKKETDFTTRFDKQLKIQSGDGRFQFQIGGRIMIDAAYIQADKDMETAADAAGNLFEGSGVEFRQTRLAISGLLYEKMAFQNEFDFSGGGVSFQENWIEFQKIPYLGKMRIGHTKEPFSLERMNSRLYLMCMEQALPDGIVPGRNTGIRFLNFIDQPRLSWSLGFFKETDGAGEGFSKNGDYNVTGRLTLTPWFADQGRKVLHLGLGYSRKITDETLRFRKGAETHISDFQPLDTGRIPADGADMLGPEISLVCGPFSLQGEYWFTRVDSDVHDDPRLQGYYVTAGFFLTGESRKYALRGNDGAEFGLVSVKTPFDPAKGQWGAWETAVRYAAVDLNDNDLYGGKMDDITLALNWYLNANLRWSFNYIRFDVKDSYAKAGIDHASGDVFQTRLSVYF